jgi:hypothetical protein
LNFDQIIIFKANKSCGAHNSICNVTKLKNMNNYSIPPFFIPNNNYFFLNEYSFRVPNEALVPVYMRSAVIPFCVPNEAFVWFTK